MAKVTNLCYHENQPNMIYALKGCCQSFGCLASFALKPSLPKGGFLACREAERQKIGAHLQNGVAQGGSSQVLKAQGTKTKTKDLFTRKYMEIYP